MELSPRRRAAAELVRPGARLADVGTDHAYLPVWLILRGTVGRAIATDVRPGPLARAGETARRYGAGAALDLRLCDGLDGIRPGEADTVALCGMGGETIAHILERAPWTRGPGVSLILQPMSSQSDLRAWLAGNGYAIGAERLVREGDLFYNVLPVRGGQEPPMTQAELWAGRQNDGPLRGAYLGHLIAQARRALEGRRAAGRRDEDAIRQLTERLEGLEMMRQEWETWQR